MPNRAFLFLVVSSFFIFPFFVFYTVFAYEARFQTGTTFAKDFIVNSVYVYNSILHMAILGFIVFCLILSFYTFKQFRQDSRDSVKERKEIEDLQKLVESGKNLNK